MNIGRILDLVALTLFVLPVPIVVIFQAQIFYWWDFVSSIRFENDPSTEVYDFIIVGAGSAGAVVANRLSKNSKVLLLEAGGYPPWPTYVPLFATSLQGRVEINWGYTSVPQKYSQFSLPNNQSKLSNGKVLGGSSTLNYMLYIGAHPNDYDNWANITGDNGWTYESVLPFFKKSMIYNGEHDKLNSDQYGESAYGGLHVEAKPMPQPIYNMVRDAAHEKGLPEVDLNGPQRKGFGTLKTTTHQGRRWSTFSAFLEPILDRKNLRILKYTQATKVKLDSEGRTVGAWIVRHGRKYFVKASKEIIVSGGTYGSPKLLMLSGIGQKEDLQKLGIKSKADLPVGKYLKDHVVSPVMPFIFDQKISTLPERDFGLDTILEYFFRGTGHFIYASLIYALAFVNSTVAPTEWPDIQHYFLYSGIYETLPKDLSELSGVSLEKYKNYLRQYLGRDGMVLAVELVRPKSAGNLKLRSKDTNDMPLIDPKYLEHPDDVKALVDGIKSLIDLVENSKVFKEVNSRMPRELRWPGCEGIKEQRSDEYWECFVRHVGIGAYHPVGTCRMGRGMEDPKAVVDSKLRVLKTKGLRVADASVMPEIVNGNTNAPTIMIGEKAADMIREYWSEQYLVSDRFSSIFFASSKKLRIPANGQCFYTKLV